MDWKKFWNKRAEMFSDALAKVGRGEGGAYADEQAKFKRTVDHLDQLLDLQATDTVLDVCCGNGLVADHLASKVKVWYGADFTESLVKEANEKNLPNATFIQANAFGLSKVLDQQFSKVLLHFSLQYFQRKRRCRRLLIELFKCTEKGGKVLISDIPDRAKRKSFYKTRKQKLRFHVQRLRGREDMGAFFRQHLLLALAEECGFIGELIEQDPSLPYAHYRFDLLLTRP